jgi:peptidoglycan hydrolase-like protein with peptidoglycan-binding domain
MVASKHKRNSVFTPALVAACFFVLSFAFPHTSFADTAYGNGTYGSGNYGGLVVDVTPPVLTNIASSTSQTGATITWTTDENANSRIDIGTTALYGTASTSVALATSHSITITGLTANTTYHFRVQSADALSNTATSSDLTLKTAAVPDTTPPVITAISSGTPGQATATITWTTDEAASSSVSYGTTISYGAASTSATFVTSHSLLLSGLAANTTYHFQVASADLSNNVTTSSDQIFTTAVTPDTTPPAITISAPINGSTVSGSSVVFAATASDNIAVAGVKFYADTTLIGTEDTVFPYTVNFDSTMLSNGIHAFSAVARDTSNNYATTTVTNVTVNNTTPDTTPPAISSISANPSDQAATIHWTTDEAATSIVDYGVTAGYGSVSTSATLVSSHLSSLSALTASTIYHFRVVSADASGNTSTSSDQTFTTTVTPSVVAPIVIVPGHFSGSGPAYSPPGGSSQGGSGVSVSAPFIRNLDVKSTGSDVTNLQNFLIQGGYLTAGNNTGYFGALTQAALARFQKARGISPAVGYFGAVTRAAIAGNGSSLPSAAVTATGTATFMHDLTIDSTGEDVRALQQWLNVHGYAIAASGAGSPGKETTTFGPATQTALARFQKAHNISPTTGYFGSITRAAINNQ